MLNMWETEEGIMARALVIDDDQSIRNLITKMLILAGFEVDECVNGKEGELTLKKNNYDIVTLDLHMPVLDGESLLRNFRKSEDKIPPIVVISGNLTDSKIQDLKKLGVKGFINKPFGMETFFKEMERHVPVNMV